MGLVPVFAHGFDDTDTANVGLIVEGDGPALLTNSDIQTSGGRNNGRYFRSLNSNSRFLVNVPATVDTYAFAAAINPIIFVGNNEIIGFDDNLIGQVSIKLRADRRLEVRLNDDNGTLLGLPGTAVLSAGTWTHIAVWVKIATGGAGRVVVKVNSLVDIDTGSVTTRFTANNYITQVRVGGYNNGNNIRDIGFDDVWAATAAGTSAGDGYGDLYFPASVPTANDVVQFTPSAGTNFENVDDSSPDGDATYNVDATVGHQDTFVMSDLVQPLGVIPFVEVHTIDRKEDSGGVILRHVIDVGGVVSEGPDFAPSVSYDFHQSFFMTQPNGDPWSVAAVNSMKTGYKYQAFI